MSTPEIERDALREEVEHQIFNSLSIPTNECNRSLIRPVLIKYAQKLLTTRDAELREKIEKLRKVNPHIGIGHLHDAECDSVYNQTLSDVQALLTPKK